LAYFVFIFCFIAVIYVKGPRILDEVAMVLFGIAIYIFGPTIWNTILPSLATLLYWIYVMPFVKEFSVIFASISEILKSITRIAIVYPLYNLWLLLISISMKF